MRRYLLAGLALLLIEGLAGVASAEQEETSEVTETGSETESGDRERARTHFNEGLRLMDQEVWTPALAEFEASLQFHPNPTAHYNRALCLSNLNRSPEAHAALRQYLDLVGEQLDSEERTLIEQELARLRSLLAEVTVLVDQEGARISIDGDEVGSSPLDEALLLQEGTHSIRVVHDGFQPENREIRTRAGRPRTERFELEPQVTQASLRIESNVVDASVLVDGTVVGTTPYQGTISAGTHHVEVHATGHEPGELAVSLSAGEDRIATINLALIPNEGRGEGPRRRAHRAWFWSMIGLSAASALSTLGLGIAVHVADSEYDPDDENAVDQYDRGQSLMTGFDVALALSCTAAAAALVLAFFTDWRRRHTQGEDTAMSSAFRVSSSIGEINVAPHFGRAW